MTEPNPQAFQMLMLLQTRQIYTGTVPWTTKIKRRMRRKMRRATRKAQR